MARILIADPDPSFRNALNLWLNYRFGIDETIQVSDGECLLEIMVQGVPAVDVVLMDWSLPNRSDPDVWLEIQESHPGLEWVILSVDPSVSIEAKKATRWFIQKGASLDNLSLILEEILGGVLPESPGNHRFPSDGAGF